MFVKKRIHFGNFNHILAEEYKNEKKQSCGNKKVKVQLFRRRICREGKPLLNRDGLMCIYMFSIDTTTDTNIHILHYGASDGLPGNQL